MRDENSSGKVQNVGVGSSAELEERLAEKDAEIEELREQVAALTRQVNNLASSR